MINLTEHGAIEINGKTLSITATENANKLNTSELLAFHYDFKIIEHTGEDESRELLDFELSSSDWWEINELLKNYLNKNS